MKPKIPDLNAINLEKWKAKIEEDKARKTFEAELKNINDYWDSRNREIDLIKKSLKKAYKKK